MTEPVTCAESIGETLFSPMDQEIHELLTESRTEQGES